MLELQSNAISTLANNQIPGTNTWISIINWLNDFIKPIENEYEKLRPQVIEESLNITKTICPIYSLDGSVDYSAHVAKLEEDRKEMADMNEMYSLFMKKEDDSNGQN